MDGRQAHGRHYVVLSATVAIRLAFYCNPRCPYLRPKLDIYISLSTTQLRLNMLYHGLIIYECLPVSTYNVIPYHF